MTHPNLPPAQETLTPEQLLIDMGAVQECFPLVAGATGASGETYEVEIAGCHAPMADFFDGKKLMDHLRDSAETPTVRLSLEISDDFRFVFDSGEEWFRVGKGAFLHVSGRRVPVRLVTLEFADFSTSWLYRDERDDESLASQRAARRTCDAPALANDEMPLF